jgi:hypothetical protein
MDDWTDFAIVFVALVVPIVALVCTLLDLSYKPSVGKAVVKMIAGVVFCVLVVPNIGNLAALGVLAIGLLLMLMGTAEYVVSLRARGD